MKFIKPNLNDNPDEVHSYFNNKCNFANQFHWKAIRYASDMVVPAKGKVIEIGCGEGYLLPSLSYHFEKVVAVDKSPKMINIAKKYFKYKNVFYVQDDITSPTNSLITQEKYNWVICLETLEHIPDINRALKNIIDMVMPGGKILISVPVEIGFPLLIKEIGRFFSYGKCSDWNFSEFIFKVFRSREKIKRKNYGNHFGFDYREIFSFISKLTEVRIEKISFFPINSKYLGFRAYIVIKK